ncbi:MAG: glycosyltransferase [archaeon]|nr:glycosyltransferase [archaeon]
MPVLSLCMIVKNEEEHLESCLNSVNDLVDEIVIVDTGSTDKTKEIAKKFTKKLFDFAWCDDFAAARNESLKHATGDWVLVLDGDETLAENDLLQIREIINRKDVVGSVLIQRNYIKDLKDVELGRIGGMNVLEAGHGDKGFIKSDGDNYFESKNLAGWFATPIVRLFKRQTAGSLASFNGVVHEDVTLSLKGDIMTTNIPIHHKGKLDVESWKNKWALYEHLGEKKAEVEKDYHAYFELGRQYAASKKLDKAKEMFQKSISLNKDFWLSWFNLGSISLLEDNLNKAQECLERARTINPNAVMIYSNLGVVYAKKKEYPKSLEILTLGLNLDPNQPSIFKNMALCYKELGDMKRAQLAWRKAVQLNPGYAVKKD